MDPIKTQMRAANIIILAYFIYFPTTNLYFCGDILCGTSMGTMSAQPPPDETWSHMANIVNIHMCCL